MSARIRLIGCLLVVISIRAVDAAAADFPATQSATSSTSDLRAFRQDLDATAELLRDVNNQLDAIARAANISAPAATMPSPSLPPELRERRLKALNEQKQRYQFMADDLGREVRELTKRLAIGGMNVTGSGPGPIEQQIDELTRRQLAMELEQQQTAAATTQAANKSVAAARLQSIAERRDALRAELADLQNMMLRYNELKSDYERARGLLRQTNDEIDRLDLAARTDFTPAEARERQNNLFLERSVMLNNLKQRYQLRLLDLRREITDTESKELADTFAGVVDVFLTPEELKSNTPALSAVTFDGTREVAGKRLIRLKSADRTWSIDPSRILVVRGSTKRD